MPTYQYACTVCDHGFEVVQAFTDDALTECPQCEGRLRKVFGSVGVVFKGSGFYRTDSRDKPKSESTDKAKGDGKVDGAKADGKPKSDTSSTSSTSGSNGSSSNGSSGSSSASKTPSTAGSAA